MTNQETPVSVPMMDTHNTRILSFIRSVTGSKDASLPHNQETLHGLFAALTDPVLRSTPEMAARFHEFGPDWQYNGRLRNEWSDVTSGSAGKLILSLHDHTGGVRREISVSAVPDQDRTIVTYTRHIGVRDEDTYELGDFVLQLDFNRMGDGRVEIHTRLDSQQNLPIPDAPAAEAAQPV